MGLTTWAETEPNKSDPTPGVLIEFDFLTIVAGFAKRAWLLKRKYRTSSGLLRTVAPPRQP